jgi:hypothetical protein
VRLGDIRNQVRTKVVLPTGHANDGVSWFVVNSRVSRRQSRVFAAPAVLPGVLVVADEVRIEAVAEAPWFDGSPPWPWPIAAMPPFQHFRIQGVSSAFR